MHRWKKHLDPDLVKGYWSKEEDEKVKGKNYTKHLTQSWLKHILQLILCHPTLDSCVSSYCVFALTDRRAGGQTRQQTLVFDCQAPEGTGGETVP